MKQKEETTEKGIDESSYFSCENLSHSNLKSNLLSLTHNNNILQKKIKDM